MFHVEHLKNCPVCNAENFASFLECKDHTVSSETFSVVSCNACSFRFTNPRPEEDQLGRYYESEEYISHSNTSKGLINFLYQSVRRHTLNRKLKLINTLSEKGELLDIGCGTGEFLHTCEQIGWKVQGIEPNEKARRYAIDQYGVPVGDEAGLGAFENNRFDVITLWHVLEHVPRLKERVMELKRLLKEKGALIIAVPNCASKDARKYKAHWAAYDLPRHLYHFTPSTIKLLFEQHGFKMQKMLPMPFDAFYVSMLSEQYRNGKSLMNFLKGFLFGLQSNLSAMTKPGTYSSQIYIFRKVNS